MYPNMTLSNFLEFFGLKEKTVFPIANHNTAPVQYARPAYTQDNNKIQETRNAWVARKDWLIMKANGDETLTSTKAARRICANNGINWQG